MRPSHFTFYKKKSKSNLFALLVAIFTNAMILAQTPGLIYKPSSTAFGRSILDPNGDGFTSPTNAGFSGTDYGTGSELRMIPLPILQGEPHSDLSTGASGGHTDIVSALVNGQSSRESAYILYKTVAGVAYVIIRIRIGKASTSPKGYSFLLNTDGNFDTGSPGANPGYDREVVLETGNPGRVAIYSHSGATTNLLASFPSSAYSQYSVALSTTNGNPDYFYDFFVPFSAIGIASNPVGITAVTVTSAGSGITGTISDFNGVDDRLYSGNRNAIMNALITTFPAVPITQLTEDFDYETQWKPATLPPVVDDGITKNSTFISGISTEANGTIIYVYKNGNSTPIGTTTVSSGVWTLSGVSGLVAGNLITAKALATGKIISGVSNTVIVSGVQDCFIHAPVNLNRNTSNNSITGSWSGNFSPNGSNVRIELYTQTGPEPDSIKLFTIPGTSNAFVQANGTFSIATGLTNNDFSNTNFVAKAVGVSNNCVSGFSNVTIRTNGNTSVVGYITPKPTVTTSPIYQSSSAQSIIVSNNGADKGQTINGVAIPTNPVSAVLILYVNGIEVSRSPNTISANSTHTFSVAGLLEEDVVTARAQGIVSGQNYWISYVSNSVTVQLQTPAQTQAPTITGTYTSGSGKTINGISLEPAGTVITIYKNGTLIGIVSVSAYGTWQLAGQTLATNDVLTAKAKATSKSLSVFSNSVTVVASLPSAPSISGQYTVGNSTISGTGGSGLVIIYVDGSPIGSVIPDGSGNWSLSGINAENLYRGAVITAVNQVNGVQSLLSAEKQVAGVASFEITKQNGDPIIEVVSGDVIQIKIKAKDNVGGSGNDFTAFEENVTLSGTTPVILGEGITSNFVSGVLGQSSPKDIALGGSGNNKKIIVINPNDPTAFGEATVNVLPAFWKGRQQIGGINDIDAKGHKKMANWTHNRVPLKGADVKFDPEAYQDMVIEDENYEWNNLDFNGSDKNLVLVDNNLSVKSISNRTTNVVKTTGNGKLKMNLMPGDSVLFPVANSSNNHLVIKNETNEQDTFSVRVFDNFFTNGTSGDAATGNFVKRTWDISKNNPISGGGINLEFFWNVDEERGDEFGSYDLFHYQAGRWVKEGVLTVEDLTAGNKKGTLVNYTGTFSPFSIGDENGVALPVELLYLAAKSVDDKFIKLDWATATEINNEGFEIQKSIDGTFFQTIGWVAGAGNHTGKINYNFVDTEVKSSQTYYYRLKQLDFDGKIEYSKIVSAAIGKHIPDQQINIYPNPAKDFVKIELGSLQDKIVSISVYNTIGNQVYYSNQSNQNQIDLSGLPSGIYMVSVMTTNHTFSKKLNILK
jgi:hypothetical protein